MNTVIHIWDILVKSNTFNFIVMLFILGWIVKKFAIKDSLEGLKNSVINSIEKAKEEKENAKLELQKAEKSVENLEEEISSRIKSAKQHAENVAEKKLSRLNLLQKQQKHRQNLQKII